jgi:hypothetical protein
MNYDEIYNKINHKYYSTKLEYPSYKVNNEYEKSLRKEALFLYREDENRLHKLFTIDLRLYAEYELGRFLTDKQWDAIFNKAWSDGHSSGYGDVLSYISELIDIVK